MSSIVRFLNRLSVRIITTIVLLVSLLVVIICFFAFQVFTQTMIREAVKFTEEIAESASMGAATCNYQELLELGQDGLAEVDAGIEYGTLKIDRSGLFLPNESKEVNLYYSYYNLHNRIMPYFTMKDITHLEVIVPDPDTHYLKYAAIFGLVINSDGSGHLDDLGDEKTIESKKLKNLVESLWNGTETDDYIIDYTSEGADRNEITVCRRIYYQKEATGLLIVKRSIDNVVKSWNRFVIGISVIGGSLVLIGTLLMGVYLRIRIGKPLRKVTMEANRFARANEVAEHRLAGHVGNITEIRGLAESIDKMEEDTMKNMDEIAQMSRESERIETELSLAASLQVSVLPKSERFSDREEFDVAALMHPAREIGGDFYDFFFIDDTHLVLLIADVSDKGVGAAFFMAISKTLLKARASMIGSPAEIVSFAEEKLSEENEQGMFITAWLGIVDLVTGEVKACNAGHNYPALMRADTGEGYRIEKTEHGPPICFLPDMQQVDYEFRMNPGDRLFLYTDGVTEAKNPKGARFGNARMIEALNEDREIGDESLILRLKAAVDRFAGEEPQYDDISMVSFTYHGRREHAPSEEE